MNYRILTLCILTITLINSSAEAQLFKRMHAKKDEHAPKAILIQLSTYQNREAYFKKQGKTALLEILQRDRDSVMHKMVADFKDNFSYCPMYFFIDTNSRKIRNKEFEGILLDEDLRPVNHPKISGKDNYFIVQFGIPAKGSEGEGVAALTSSKHQLIVCDDQLNKLERPLPDGSNNKWPGKIGYQLETYHYDSPKFDISYRPYASHFNAKLLHFYGLYPYNN